MSLISEEFALKDINVKPHYRLPVSRAGDSYLINDGENSIVKVTDHKQVHSWTLKHPHSFTCPVVFHEKDESIYCIISDNVFSKWFLSDVSLSSAIKHKFQENMFAIICIPESDPVILFVSGEILETNDFDAEPCKKLLLEEEEEIVWADGVLHNANKFVVCLSRSKLNQKYRLHCISISENFRSYSLRLWQNNILKSWSLNKETFSLLTLWANGSIVRHQLDTQTTKVILLQKNNQRELICVVDSDHAVLLTSDSSQNEWFLELWDIKFIALKFSKKLEKAVNYKQIHCIDSILFLANNKELSEVICQVKKSNLATVIAKSVEGSTKCKEFTWGNRGELSNMRNRKSTNTKMKVDSDQNTPSTQTEVIAERLIRSGYAFLKSIPDCELVKLLQYAIRCKSQVGKTELNSGLDSLLIAIFNSPFSDFSLSKYMKMLNLQEIMIILETLLSYPKHDCNANETSKNPSPSDYQIFSWMCLIIQSHMEALLLSKDKRNSKLLSQLNKYVSEKIVEYEDLEKIYHLSHILQKRNILPEKSSVGKYSIESLNL